MSLILKVMQGAYAYLLIFQILVVTLLFLTLLWMLVRRIRLAAEAGELPTTSAPNATTGADTANLTGEVSKLLAESQQTVTALRAQISQLENQLLNSGSSTEAAAGAADPKLAENHQLLQEKVKYLEGKLLEYEILQEEIGTLSSLKIENEQLKAKVTKLEAGSTPATSSATEASAPAAPIEMPTAPTSVEEEDLKREPTFEAEALASVLETKPPEPAPTAPPVEPTPAAAPVFNLTAPSLDSGAPTLASLESLLHQIDELTKSPPEAQK
jgi:hypothetical protein